MTKSRETARAPKLTKTGSVEINDGSQTEIMANIVRKKLAPKQSRDASLGYFDGLSRSTER